jgi:hypothetical protein
MRERIKSVSTDVQVQIENTAQKTTGINKNRKRERRNEGIKGEDCYSGRQKTQQRIWQK